MGMGGGGTGDDAAGGGPPVMMKYMRTLRPPLLARVWVDRVDRVDRVDPAGCTLTNPPAGTGGGGRPELLLRGVARFPEES